MLTTLRGKLLLGLLGGRTNAPRLGAVQNLAITGASSGEVADLTPELTWDAPVDDGYGAVNTYTLEYADNALFNNSTTVTGITATNYTLSTQLNATYLYARITPVRGGVSGATSSAVSALMLVAITRDDYPGNVAAPLAGSRTPQVGSDYTITDTAGVLSIVNGELVPSGNSTGNADPQFLDSHPRAAGRTASFRWRVPAAASGINAWDMGLFATGGSIWGLHGMGNGAAYWVFDGGNQVLVAQTAAAADVYDMLDVVEFASAGYAIFLNKRLIWITERASNATMQAILKSLSASKRLPTLDRYLMYDNDAPFTSIANLALVNENPPTSGVEYTTAGDIIAQAMFTAEAGSLTSERGITLRKSVAQVGVDPDYWRVYFDTSGDLQIQQYLADVGQGATSLGTGLLAAGASLGIRVVADRSYIKVWTYTTAFASTSRGAAQGDGVLNDNAVVSFAAGDGTIGQAWVHPISASAYQRLNPGFTPASSYSADDLGELQELLDTSNTITLEADRTYTFTEFQALIGNGRSNLHITSDTTDPAHYPTVYKSGYDDDDVSYSPGRNTFQFTNCPNLEIDHIKFTGDHLLANGWTNGQASAISLLGAGNTNAHLHHLLFEDLPGFPIQGLGYSAGIVIHHINYSNCGNGVNVASDNSKFYNITFDHSEALEVLGDNAEIGVSGAISGTNTYGGFSLGGNQGTTVSNGMVVTNCTIDTLVAGNVAFIVSENLTNITLNGVIAINAPFGFSAQSQSALRPSTGILFLNCIAIDCGEAYYLPNTDGDIEVELDGCISTGAETLGLNCANPDANVHDSSFTGSGTFDVRLTADAAGMTFVDNTYDTISDLR